MVFCRKYKYAKSMKITFPSVSRGYYIFFNTVLNLLPEFYGSSASYSLYKFYSDILILRTSLNKKNPVDQHKMC